MAENHSRLEGKDTVAPASIPAVIFTLMPGLHFSETDEGTKVV